MKCINCGRKLKKDAKYCSDCGLCQENVEIINANNKKSNKAFIITIFLLLIISVSISVCIIAFHNSNKNNKKDNIDILIDEDKEILFKNYILKVPDGFSSYKNKLNSYIKNDYYIVFYKEYPLGYKDIINNKELLINELQKQGFTNIELNSKKINEDDYILIKSKLDDIDYGLILYEFDSDTNIFLTITANNLSRFEDKWFDETIEFLKTNKMV